MGIAYGIDEAAVLGEIRNRDFTPSEDARFEAMGKQADGLREAGELRWIGIRIN